MGTSKQAVKAESGGANSAMSLLVGLFARVGALETGTAEYLSRFASDLEKVHKSMKELSDDLKSNFHICPQLSQRLLSRQSAEEFFVLLDNDRSQRHKTTQKLGALISSLNETDRVLEYFPKLEEKKSVLDRIGDFERRREIKSVFESCKEVKEELLEWKKSAHRSLEKIAGSGLLEKLDVRRPEGSLEGGGRKTAAAGPRDAKAGSNESGESRPGRQGRATKGQRVEERSEDTRGEEPQSGQGPGGRVAFGLDGGRG